MTAPNPVAAEAATTEMRPGLEIDVARLESYPG
jgi:hypothetical protein